jgi:orotate phosphoribosyltransferase
MKNYGFETAKMLLQSTAIKLNPAKPFIWASGIKSPIYCDNRKTLSYPDIRGYIKEQFKQLIRENFEKPELIAGVATGAIAQGALVANDMDLPFVYIRSTPKTHGLENLIEGVVKSGQRVVVVEDLVSTGGSSLKAVEALRKEGCEVLGMVAIFTYGFKKAEASFEKAGCNLYTLCNYDILLDHALETGYIQKNELDVLKNWKQDPENWKPEY